MLDEKHVVSGLHPVVCLDPSIFTSQHVKLNLRKRFRVRGVF